MLVGRSPVDFSLRNTHLIRFIRPIYAHRNRSTDSKSGSFVVCAIDIKSKGNLYATYRMTVSVSFSWADWPGIGVRFRRNTHLKVLKKQIKRKYSLLQLKDEVVEGL